MTARILLFDIETAMMQLRFHSYRLKQFSNYIPPEAIERDIWIVCAAWKWLGDTFIASTSVLKDEERFKNNYADDYHVVKTLYDLIEAADILIAHNGDKFDWKIFISRCIFHGFPPPVKPLMIDTLKVARKEAGFSSNKLSYLAKFLGVEDKAERPDWEKIAVGDREAIEYSEKYCRQDIRTLEGIYLKLRPYITNHPNLNVMSDNHHNVCPNCGHWDLEKRGSPSLETDVPTRRFVPGHRFTGAGKYQRYKCKLHTGGCAANSYGRKNLKTVEIR